MLYTIAWLVFIGVIVFAVPIAALIDSKRQKKLQREALMADDDYAPDAYADEEYGDEVVAEEEYAEAAVEEAAVDAVEDVQEFAVEGFDAADADVFDDASLPPQ